MTDPNQMPPTDPGNPFLGERSTTWSAQVIITGEDTPNSIHAVAAQASGPDGAPVGRVLITGRNPSATVTVLLDAVTARALSAGILAEAERALPLIVLPPPTAAPGAPGLIVKDLPGTFGLELKRLVLTLETDDARAVFLLDAQRARAVVGLIERAAAQLSGIVLPT